MTDRPNPSHIMDTDMALWPSQVLLAAVSLGAFTTLDADPMRGVG